MTRIALTILAAAVSLSAPAAMAETLMFTSSNLVSLPSAQVVGAGGSACVNPFGNVAGTCGAALTFGTSAGALTVTAADGPDVDTAALVFQGNSSAGLGVVEGYYKSGAFKITDGNYSLDTGKETLTLTFASSVKLTQAYFFADDRTNTLRELDSIDGFTVSVNGGAFQEFGFGTNSGLPVTLGGGLVGTSFTFGYAKLKSVEDYYLAGVSFTAMTPAIPEPSTYALMALGLVGVAAAARRARRA